MAFKMKGWNAFTKNINKTMDNSSKADGRAKSSAFQSDGREVYKDRATAEEAHRKMKSPSGSLDYITKEGDVQKMTGHMRGESGISQSQLQRIEEDRKKYYRERGMSDPGPMRKDEKFMKKESKGTVGTKTKYKDPDQFKGPGGYIKNTANVVKEKTPEYLKKVANRKVDRWKNVGKAVWKGAKKVGKEVNKLRGK